MITKPFPVPILPLAIAAVVLMLAGCSAEHTTQVQLPNGVTCKSEKSGALWWETTNMSCVDSTGKVIGSYQSN